MERDVNRRDRTSRVIREDDRSVLREEPVAPRVDRAPARDERTMPQNMDAFADDPRPIDLVREGMNVIDASGEKIGTVEYVKSGDPDAATLSDFPDDRGIVEDFARAFGYQDEPRVPSPLHERFLRRGFIKIDAAGLFGSDRYVAADSIERVSSDTVWLNAHQDHMAEAQ